MKTLSTFRRSIVIILFILVNSPWANAETGVSDTEIRLGVINVTSGALSLTGSSTVAGTKLYLEKINKAGGVHGRKLVLLTADDEYKPEKTAALTEKMINEDKVFALFNFVGTPTIRAALPIARRHKVPILFPRTGDKEVRVFEQYAFHYRASYEAEVAEMMKEYVEKRKLKKIAILAQNDGLGNSLGAAARKALSQYGLKAVAVGMVERNSADINAAFETIAAANPEAVIFAATHLAGTPFVKKAVAEKKKWQFFGTSANNGLIKSLADVDVEFILSQVTPNPSSSTLPLAAEFRTEIPNLPKDKPIDHFAAFEAYVTTAILVEGLKRAGKNLTRDSFMGALEKEPIEIGGFKTNFSATVHEAGAPPSFIHVKGGKITELNF